MANKRLTEAQNIWLNGTGMSKLNESEDMMFDDLKNRFVEDFHKLKFKQISIWNEYETDEAYTFIIQMDCMVEQVPSEYLDLNVDNDKSLREKRIVLLNTDILKIKKLMRKYRKMAQSQGLDYMFALSTFEISQQYGYMRDSGNMPLFEAFISK